MPEVHQDAGRGGGFDSIGRTRDTGDPTAAPSCPRAHGRRVHADREGTRARRRTTSSSPSSRCLWSEHCGYKHSRLELRRLPTHSARVLQGPGENAGVIDVGDGLAIAFKVESHNHPSAVEPYQGAATGVGGILRDIFAMGARPIALGDSLRLGPLDEERPRELFRGIVRGIGGYGNCVGVPNVAGETVFDAAYRQNPLVNALCIGLLRADELVRASAGGPRQPRRPVRRDDGPRRDRRRERPGLAGSRRERRGQAPDRAGGRSVHGQEADRVHARARRASGWSSPCRTWAPRASRRPPPRWPRAAASASSSSSSACRCASRTCSRSR